MLIVSFVSGALSLLLGQCVLILYFGALFWYGDWMYGDYRCNDMGCIYIMIYICMYIYLGIYICRVSSAPLRGAAVEAMILGP